MILSYSNSLPAVPVHVVTNIVDQNVRFIVQQYSGSCKGCWWWWWWSIPIDLIWTYSPLVIICNFFFNSIFNIARFETDDGVTRQETGVVKEVFDEENKPHTVVVVRGSFSYKKSDGSVETVDYSADENGFRAEGDSIPKIPAVRR